MYRASILTAVLLLGFAACRTDEGDDGSMNYADSPSAGADAGGSSGGGSGGTTNPVTEAIVNPNGCSARPLPSGSPGTPTDGRLLCYVIEATYGQCDCTRPGRTPSSAGVMDVVREEVREIGLCGESTPRACSDFCGCDIAQFSGTATDSGSDLFECQNQVTIGDIDLVGFCYIDAERTDAMGAPAPLGNPELVSDCPATSRRRIRFLGEKTPETENTVPVLVCGL